MSESKQSHSAERWNFTSLNKRIIWSADEAPIAEVYREANAARIVACVNFCAGKSNEELQLLERALENKEGRTPIQELEHLNAQLCAKLQEIVRELTSKNGKGEQ